MLGADGRGVDVSTGEEGVALGGLEVANGPAPVTQPASRGARNIHQNLRIVYLASVFYFLTR